MVSTKNLGILLIAFSVILLFVLIAVKINIDKQEAFLCETVHSYDLDAEQCPAHESSNSWLIVVAFVAVFIIFGAGVYMILMPVKGVIQEIKEFKEVNLSKLSEEEKNIYEILKKNDGSMYQSDLIKETGFSKVKVTRILDKMASKKIVDRNRRGMTNIVVLR